MKPRKGSKCCRTFGRILRILIFCLNAIAWTVGTLCIVGGILIAFYSRTVKLTWLFDFYDLTLTTPATILLYYGVLLGITTISGCFAGTGGRWWSTGLYCLLLITLAILDYFWGIQVFFKRSSLMDFLDSMAESMTFYLDKDAMFGIYPRNVKEYWDHIQQQSHCCGMFNWADWKDTPIGKDLNVPDSCCNENYAHPGCGVLLLRHPDNADHQLLDIIHPKGCLKAYPRRYIWAFLEASLLGIILAVILLIDFILSLILFIIVITCFYRPGKPITEPTVIRETRHKGHRGHRGRSRPAAVPNSERESRRHSIPHGGRRRTLSSSPEHVTHDQFGRRQKVKLPSGQFEIEIEQDPQRDLEVII